MAQQTIGIGSAANDGTGDPLRTAFNKINDNFTELYGTSAFGQQITLSGNKVSSNVTNANLVLEASGTGAIEFEGFQIRDNHIEGTRSNEDIRITANGTGNIFVGAIKLNGTTFSSDDSTLITFAEGVDVTGALTGTSASLSTTLAVTGTTTLTGATTVNNTLTANSVTTNAISSNGSNADISIQPSGTGDVVISALRVNGTTLDSSDSTSVTIAEAVDITGALTGTSGSFSTTLGVTGLTTLSGGATVLGTMTAGSVTTNAISSNGSNADISIQPSGTGDVVLSALRVNGTTLDSSDSTAINLAENVDVTGTLTTADITTTGNIVVSGNIAPATLSIGDLNITADGSITSDSNGDIVIDPAGTGEIVLTGTITHTGTQTTTGQLNVDNLRIDGNTISAPSSGGITLTPQAGSTVALGGIATATEFQATLAEITTVRAQRIENDTSNTTLEIGSQGTGNVKIGQTEFSSSASTITGLVTNGDMTFTPQGTGDFKVDAHINLVEQSGDATGETDSAHIYAKADSGSAEVFVRDEAGNVTKISPHNEKGNWEYYSKNIKTGKIVRVDMEELIKDIENITGKQYINTH